MGAPDGEDYARRLQQRLGPARGEVAQALAQFLPLVAGDNPQEAKRFTNRVLLSTALARRASLELPLHGQIAFVAADFRWPGVTAALSHQPALLAGLKDCIDNDTPAANEESQHPRALLQENPGLGPFLKASPGRELLKLSQNELSQLLLYTALVRQEEAPERRRRLNLREVMAAVNQGHSLLGADLSGINLSFATLAGVTLCGADLSMANLCEADLSRARLSAANLSSANLSEARLPGADLFAANLCRADLSMSILCEAELFAADLSRANLSLCDLSEANLSHADLSRCNLRRADLTEARLCRTTLLGANLSWVNLYQADLRGAVLDEQALLTLGEAKWRDAIWDSDVRQRLEKMFPENG